MARGIGIVQDNSSINTCYSTKTGNRLESNRLERSHMQQEGKATQKGALPVSLPPSLISASDNMSNSVASVGDASSVSASVSSVPSSPQPAPMPAVEYGKTPAVTAVEPQNPFDSVILEKSQSGSSEKSGGTPSLMQTPTRGSAATTSPPEQTGLNSPVVNLTASPTPPTNLLTPSRTAPVITTPARNNSNTNIPAPVQQTPPPPAASLQPPPAVLPPLPRTNITNINNINTSPQLNQQQRRMFPVQQPPPPQQPHLASDASTDDDNTAPSSAANTAERTMHPDSEDGGGGALRRNHGNHNRNTSLTRFLDHTRRRLTSRANGDSDEEEMDPQSGALIAGYLQKLGRNGKWQTRWFETDGECLSYYKSSKRYKLLATLDLQKVGLIEIDQDDSKECSFRIQVLGRLYHLRASSRAECRDWVITLNRVKEARMQQGNVKIVGSSVRSISNLLDQNSQNSTPRVVVVANRQRTRAVDEEEQWNEMIGVGADENTDDPYDPAYITQTRNRHSALSSAVVARWSKRRTSLQRLGAKLSKWARSLKKYSCAELERENVFLDRHVHPPGHDDKQQSKAAKGGHLGWIEKEASANTMSSNVTSEQGGLVPALSKPDQLKHRSMSSSSDFRVIS